MTRDVIAYTDRAEPYRGYFFKILKGQGPAAPLGQIDFIVNKVMIGGFALIAAPAAYGVTGVKTFIVSHDGVVYEKDLGAGTLDAFKKMGGSTLTEAGRQSSSGHGRYRASTCTDRNRPVHVHFSGLQERPRAPRPRNSSVRGG